MIHSIVDRPISCIFQMETIFFEEVGWVFIECFLIVIVFVKLIFQNWFITENTLNKIENHTFSAQKNLLLFIMKINELC